jgi:hypothetical protein
MADNTFEGTSNSGNFQEALEMAVEKALASGVPDDRASWKLDSLSGERGTFAGINNLTVTIRAELDSDRDK